MLTKRAQACLCSCTGRSLLVCGLNFPPGRVSLLSFLNQESSIWFNIDSKATLCKKSSSNHLSIAEFGASSSLQNTFTALDSRRGRIQRASFSNNSGGTYINKSKLVATERLGSRETLAMAEANNENVMTNYQKKRVIIIAGPTAVGKTRLALALAKCLGGEIISADSVQVYKGLDVGSAKTPVHEREGIPHHLIDIVDSTEDYAAGRFYDDARAATELVLANGSVPIVVGEQACIYDGALSRILFLTYMNGKVGAPKATKEVTVAVEEEVDGLVSEGGGWDAAVRMLADAGDPTTAQSLARNDWYRLRRALEIIKTSGQPRGAFAHSRNHDRDIKIGDADWDYDFQCYFLYQPRPDLYRGIDLRCEQMVQEGLLEEASSMLDSGLQPNMNSATRSIGYQLAMEFLMECRELDGVITEERFLIFLSAFQQSSRNLVKRQLTWFRNEGQSEQLFNWVDATQPLEVMVETLSNEYEKAHGVSRSFKEASATTKESSYREGKLLKVYQAQNRIFCGKSEACGSILEWLQRTQSRQRSRDSDVDITNNFNSSLSISL